MSKYCNYEEKLPNLRDWLTSRIQSYFSKLLYNQELSFIKNTKRGDNVIIEKFNNIKDSTLGNNVHIFHHCNIYGAIIGENTQISSFVEIQPSKIGKSCKIGCGSFISEGSIIGDSVFFGPKVMLANDKFPRACNEKGELKTKNDWKLEPVIIEDSANIGMGVCVLPGIRIGKNAMIGTGSVVTHNVGENEIWVGNPAKSLDSPYVRNMPIQINLKQGCLSENILFVMPTGY